MKYFNLTPAIQNFKGVIKRFSKIADDGNYFKGVLNSIYHKMENFILDQNSLNENNGSTQLPNLIDVLRGKNGIGMSICSKNF